MTITLSLSRNSAMVAGNGVNVNVDNLAASAAEMPFAQRLVANVCEFAKSQLTETEKETK